MYFKSKETYKKKMLTTDILAVIVTIKTIILLHINKIENHNISSRWEIFNFKCINRSPAKFEKKKIIA